MHPYQENSALNLYAIAILCCVLLFVLMPICSWFGHRSGLRILNSTPAAKSHPPLAIFLLLGGLSLVATWIIVGFGMAKSSRLSYAHVFGFAAMASRALFVLLDIEFPRHGFGTLDSVHELFLDLEQSMP